MEGTNLPHGCLKTLAALTIRPSDDQKFRLCKNYRMVRKFLLLLDLECFEELNKLSYNHF